MSVAVVLFHGDHDVAKIDKRLVGDHGYTLAESITHRDQSGSPREPSSSRMTRYSLAHTRALLQSVKRRWTVCQEAPKPGGSCRHVQPVVATNMMGGQDQAIIGSPAATSLRPLRRRRHHALKQLPQLVRNQLI
ncbi:hypothetical protein FHR33_003973 [Nonomuraea dietziae]|uniref:Uncharacterized protein n=1 Tax=Nonomuraea dietziae TaxID=65515 RepID=A0A7W5V988_9ACTN|nr:hypothetical protein [Nonomuraea dietziae]